MALPKSCAERTTCGTTLRRRPYTAGACAGRVKLGPFRIARLPDILGVRQSRYPLLPSLGAIFKFGGLMIMNKKSRSVLLLSFVPAFLLGGAFAVAQAQNAAPAATPTNWSDPDTWPNRKVPDRRRQGHHWKRQGRDPRRQSAGAGRSVDRRQTHLRQQCRSRADHRVDHAARGAGHWQRSRAPTRATRRSP